MAVVRRLRQNTQLFVVFCLRRFEHHTTVSHFCEAAGGCEDITNIVTEVAGAVAGCQKKKQKEKLSASTKEAIKKRREMKRDGNVQHIEYREVCKTVRKKIREDCRKFNVKEISECIKANRSLKKGKRDLAIGTKKISCVLSEQGEQITNQDQILERIEQFYTELYSSNNKVQYSNPGVTTNEVRSALSQMSNDKAVGPDRISTEALKAGNTIIHKQLAELYTACLKGVKPQQIGKYRI